MKFLLTLLLFSPLICFTQNPIQKQLDSISTPEDAAKFLKTYKSEEGKVYIFNKEKHKTRLANELFKLSKGSKKVYKTDFKKTYYKIIDKAEVDYYKFNIIVLDGNITSDHSAKVIRDKVLSQYNEGYRFKDLAKHHSSGPTAKMGGDTGWIKLGDISDTFDEHAFNQNHTINEVFTIDDVENKKYYIVMKTQDKALIEEITVIKLTEDLN